ncbi:MAG: MiaB/RimO family radical SAM methylthiotransferase, partial [Patescibacteria group bacterium]|nr:MiaB/RimO family radical SAM methylthiotransferase [Patescibacteria group bacterium]
LTRRGLTDVPTGISGFGTRHRAYVKVQDGCVMPCAYCIIPKVRPRRASRPIPHVTDEVCRLIENGHREIVLTGIHLGHYGVDLPQPAAELTDLVRRLAELPGEFRIRLSSLDAVEVDDRLIDLLAEFPRRLCPHLHLSLQSGSSSVLRRMRRRDTAASFLDRCRQLQTRLALPAITTDLIVGFPGETEDDFSETCRMVEQAGFAKVHVFRFSPRNGTAAATMPDQVPDGLRHQRMLALEAIAEKTGRQYLAGLLGRPLQVLVETPLDGSADRWLGTAERYVPVEVTATAREEGQFVEATPVRVEKDRLLA